MSKLVKKEFDESKVGLFSSQILTDERIEEIVTAANKLAIKDRDDKDGAKNVIAARKMVKNYRCAVENLRKDLVRPALNYQQVINAEANRIKEKLSPVEKDLEKKEAKWLEWKEEKAAERLQERIKSLTDNGATPTETGYALNHLSITHQELIKMAIRDFAKFLRQVKAEWKEEQARRAEEERLRKIKEEADRKAKEAEEALKKIEQQKEIDRLAEIKAKEIVAKSEEEKAEPKEPENVWEQTGELTVLHPDKGVVEVASTGEADISVAIKNGALVTTKVDNAQEVLNKIRKAGKELDPLDPEAYVNFYSTVMALVSEPNN